MEFDLQDSQSLQQVLDLVKSDKLAEDRVYAVFEQVLAHINNLVTYDEMPKFASAGREKDEPWNTDIPEINEVEEFSETPAADFPSTSSAPYSRPVSPLSFMSQEYDL
ncbi:hypothetical protein PCE1_004669 [Barthelona sp. PCE]